MELLGQLCLHVDDLAIHGNCQQLLRLYPKARQTVSKTNHPGTKFSQTVNSPTPKLGSFPTQNSLPAPWVPGFVLDNETGDFSIQVP